MDQYIIKRVHKYTNEETKESTYDIFGRSNSYVKETVVGYYKNSSTFHRYFVSNFGNGMDNETIELELCDLKELSDKCLDLLNKVFIGKKIVSKNNTSDEIIISLDWLKENWYSILCNYKFKENILEDKKLLDYIVKSDIYHCPFYLDEGIDCGYVYDLIKTILMFEDVFKNHDPKEFTLYSYRTYT